MKCFTFSVFKNINDCLLSFIHFSNNYQITNKSHSLYFLNLAKSHVSDQKLSLSSGEQNENY